MEKQIAIRILFPQGKQLCPWKFVRLSYAHYSYGQFWCDILAGPLSDIFQLKLPCKNYLFKNATASTALSSTETINEDVETDLIKVVIIYGMHFFLIVVQHLEMCTTCHPPPPQPPPNAFNILMASAKAALGKDLPEAVVHPKNNMERLRNRVLLDFEESFCNFPRDAGKGTCTFVSRLCDLLYYIDGQLSKIEAVTSSERSIHPVFKQKFSGFNCPEQSKHRKRALNNLSEKKLESLAIQMQSYLHVMPWAEIKIQIVDPVTDIEQYCLCLRNQRMKSKLAQETPRSKLEVDCNVTIVKSNASIVNHMLSNLNAKLKIREFYVPVPVREFLPSFDRRRVHKLMRV